ncbi:MAG: prepilin-type N-terminal cleavage/methylation domain-containing protein [Acidiferrobacterales bacterium]
MRQNGFTLIELLITILVAAILATLAMPSFLSSIHGAQATSVAETFEQDVAWVRGQAVSGATASLSLATDCSWTASVDSATDAPHSMTPQQIAHDAPTLSCAGIPANGLTLSFDSLGLVDPVVSNGIVTFTPGAGLPTSVEIFGSGVIVEDPAHAS